MAAEVVGWGGGAEGPPRGGGGEAKNSKENDKWRQFGYRAEERQKVWSSTPGRPTELK